MSLVNNNCNFCFLTWLQSLNERRETDQRREEAREKASLSESGMHEHEPSQSKSS